MSVGNSHEQLKTGPFIPAEHRSSGLVLNLRTLNPINPSAEELVRDANELHAKVISLSDEAEKVQHIQAHTEKVRTQIQPIFDQLLLVKNIASFIRVLGKKSPEYNQNNPEANKRIFYVREEALLIGYFLGLTSDRWSDVPVNQELPEDITPYRREFGIKALFCNALYFGGGIQQELQGEVGVVLNHGNPELYRVVLEGN